MPTADFTPTLDELGKFMKSRTRSRAQYGTVVGTFNDDTPVTANEAEELIAQAADEVAIAVGSTLPDGPDDEPDLYRRGARSLVLVLAAMNVEIALMPEQVTDPKSAYAALERRFISYRKSLIEAVSEAKGGGDGGDGDDSSATSASMFPVFTFPEPMTRLTDRF